MALSKPQISDYLNKSVWSSYSRINASQRFRVVADGGVLIPPDVAQVSMAMLGYQKTIYGDLVNGLLLPNDAVLTEQYNRNLPHGAAALPAGTTFLTPFKDHRDVLDAAEIIRPEWVWHDMPAELYLINRPGLDPALRQVLLDLGYGEAAARKAAGQPVYVPSAEAIVLADAKRAMLVPKVWSGWAAYWTARGLLSLLGVVVGVGAAIYAGLRLIDTVFYRIKMAPHWENEKRKADNTAEGNRIQMIKAETAQEMLKQHCGVGAVEPWAEERCAGILGSLAAINPVTDIPAGPPVPSSCGFSNCWPWALLGLGGGALVGGWVAKKRGWV